MIQILHNPKCSKSRLGLSYLEQKGISAEVVKYLDAPLSFDELKMVIAKLGITPFELIRKGEDVYKSEFKGKTLSDDEWIQAMVDYPRLMERPIVINGDKAVVARPTETIDSIL